MVTFDQKGFGVLCFWKGEGSKGKEIRMRSFGGEVFWNVCKRLIKTDNIPHFNVFVQRKERQQRKALKRKLWIV